MSKDAISEKLHKNLREHMAKFVVELVEERREIELGLIHRSGKVNSLDIKNGKVKTAIRVLSNVSEETDVLLIEKYKKMC